MKRKLLVVTDLGCSRFSALKRGLAYASFFDSSPRWSADFIDRSPPSPPRPSQALSHRIGRRLARQIGLGNDPLAVAAAHEATILEKARTADVVYLLKTPTADLQRKILDSSKARVVVDLNDALWLAHHGEGFRRLDEMLTTAHLVICENEYGAAYARHRNNVVRVVPDCTQLDTFDQLRGNVRRRDDGVRLGWIGSPSTAGFLYKIWEVLEALFQVHPTLELRIVGAGPHDVPHFEKVRWSHRLEYDREQMVGEALAMDIGLFPLFNVEDSLARGNGKAVVYMAAGAVAACSNIGEHTRIITDGVNGVLAATDQEWYDKLNQLIVDATTRTRIGNAGLATVRDTLTDAACFERLVDVLDEVCP